MKTLYTTEIVNENGTDGDVRITDGPSFQVSSPLNPEREGLNPEQFMGMAWSTCLNATIISLLKGRSMDHLQSRVRVTVDMCKEPEKSGYYFVMKAFVAVDSFTLEETLKLAHQADRYCPVSKLIKDNPHVFLEAESFTQLVK